MTLPGPLVILGVPLLGAVVLQLLRRWTTLMACLGGALTATLGAVMLFVPLDVPWRVATVTVELDRPLVVLGRQLLIQPSDRTALAFLFLTTAGLYLVAWRLLPHSNFFPFGLAAVTFLAAALLVEQVVYTALFVEMAAVLSVFPLHEPPATEAGEQVVGRDRALGGVRYMAYTTLALPGLMITQLFLDLFAIFPNDQGLLNTSAVLLSLSFAILFGAVPFQNWLSAVATDGSPPVVTFVFTVNLGAVWFMLLEYLQTYPWLSQRIPLDTLFANLGLLMMVLGGVLAAAQRRLGRLVAYATLVDNGAMLLALGTQQVEGLALAMLVLLARPFSMGLMTLGLQGLRRIEGDDGFDAVTGAAWRSPWRAVAFIVGGVALAGFPISLSFAARWGLYRLIAQDEMFQAFLALLGSAGVMLGLVRALRTLLSALPKNAAPNVTIAEDRVVLILIILFITAVVVFGFFPQLITRAAMDMAQWYTFF
ncbi:MAG: proton-conducting transporter membrane subunit [Anaerolineae bacterium]